MESFPNDTKFKYPWRSYQARVLSELEEHLDDNRLHVVAAPGSGKTVLGLEALRRINKPTLILAPTITIKNQWVDRFVNLFLKDCKKKPDWVSTDIKNPSFLTVSTYQGLHSAYKGIVDNEEIKEKTEEETEEEKYVEKIDIKKTNIIDKLKKAGIKTIVVDEAHHLRTEWWKSLNSVIRKLGKIKIVALTATPPYDVSPLEWDRYEQLCGPVDAEISVPELIKEKNLCSHQDLVYLSKPSSEEKEYIENFRNQVEIFLQKLCENQEFIKAIKSHPWLKIPNNHIQNILEKPEYFSSLAIFLNHIGEEIPEEFFEIIGVKLKILPKLSLKWAESLLDGCLFYDFERFSNYHETLKEIKRELYRIGAIERKKVHLKNNRKINKILTSSITKLESIFEIVKIESSSLESDLRLVVLTDYIRKTDMPRNPQDIKPLHRIGVVPIFEKIRRRKIENIKIGVLSGSLVIIPKESINLIYESSKEIGISKDKIKTTFLKHDDRYCKIDIVGTDSKRIVRLITKVFSKGGINVLIGTKSLLGEGWDAPCVNSLVLASFVGSYMLSNQMRGRAIRTQAENPDKTSNIWHLVCVQQKKARDAIDELIHGKEEDKEVEEIRETIAGIDYEMIKRRFKAFVGISFIEPVIENGIKRIDLGKPPFKDKDIKENNLQMGKYAIDRKNLIKRWDKALVLGDDGLRIVEEIEARKESVPGNLVVPNLIRALVSEGFATALMIASYSLISLNSSDNYSTLLFGLLFIGLIAALVSLPYFIKALWLLIKFGPVGSVVKQVGTALLKTLAYHNIITTDITKMGVKIQTNELKTVFCSLAGGTSYEKSLFLKSLQEIFDPINNPRYLITRKSKIGAIKRKDYHAVPTVIGRKKEYAVYFMKMWRKYVGDTNLIYTRSIEGRKVLLKARSQSLSSQKRKKTQKRSVWK